MMKRLPRIAAFCLYCLVLQEAALRVVFPVPEILNFDRGTYSPTLNDTGRQARSTLANARFFWKSDPDGVEFIHDLNLYGFRDPMWRLQPKGAGPRVAFVGDSMVEGFMAEASSTIPAAFRNELAALDDKGDVLNLGVGASGLREYTLLIRDAVPLFRPDHLILVLYVNDFSRTEFDAGWLENALEPEVARVWVPRLYYVIRGLWANRPIAPRWRTKPFAFVNAVPDPRNPWSDSSRAAVLERFVKPEIAEAMKEARFNPYLVNRFKNWQRLLLEPVDLSEPIVALNEYVAGYSCKLWVVYLPSPLQVSDHYLPYQLEFSAGPAQSLMGEPYQLHARSLEEATRELGVPFLNLTPSLRQQEVASRPMYWRYDGHMKAEGYVSAGKTIFSWWQMNR